jgi:hypothetical protein
LKCHHAWEKAKAQASYAKNAINVRLKERFLATKMHSTLVAKGVMRK